MKAIIRLDLDLYYNHLFKTKEEWDSYKKNIYQYCQKVWNDPEQFPCVVIETHLQYNENGTTDWLHHYFFYDFTLEDAGEAND